MEIIFSPLTPAHFPLLLKWLETSHEYHQSITSRVQGFSVKLDQEENRLNLMRILIMQNTQEKAPDLGIINAFKFTWANQGKLFRLLACPLLMMLAIQRRVFFLGLRKTHA